ncbi:MAG: acetyl-CoA carboxylase biotin carboxyl carrier protein subunit [Alphaproteobacteria bacterium]|nr:acetyl-CoA carboxylase biotin carboxyl carrier protein subunit [Alphaproteobacteria bacterium]MDP7182508.1 acetyl-CoA carboxylase biotin carboxyl carrier protein subunit [Alphaproteobacteria bacterium]MDP7456546.1 acetyl-CoA carboxylase biotin carboxyl carrier protein subunit [Alphaproteobacteria bacterium]HJO89438.1 acetyl-CoA carboxylase biotin carboxyl carrier protein subunit [Alphaproteobacteria bacterium]
MEKFQFDDDLVRSLAKLLEETGLTEIEFEAEGQRIRVGRNSGMVAPQSQAPFLASELENSGEESERHHPGAVTSPMVGTAYTMPEPGTPPFVSVGDTVSEGQTMLIIEAMKTMNPLPAPRDGKVVRVLVGNGDPVEFGEVLMIIE